MTVIWRSVWFVHRLCKIFPVNRTWQGGALAPSRTAGRRAASRADSRHAGPGGAARASGFGYDFEMQYRHA
eukprot:6756811-Prymnesium_polylepis.2